MASLKRIGQQIGLWLFIISATVVAVLALSFALFAIFIRTENLTFIADMSAGRLMHNYTQLMGYLTLPWVEPLKMSNFPVSANGAHHFADVKHLFLLALAVFIVSAPITWSYLRTLHARKMWWQLVRPFQIGAFIPVIFAGAFMINFDQFFIAFHKVLFRNSDWLFDPNTDPIINVLPESFFMACFIVALGIFEVVMIWGIVKGRRSLAKN
ncbi:TIGR01906 family membrane protein [Lacticaseibacillus brantae]|uniref:Integral membrane protein n=1 Tax=Lacticaseibacillus brantae DSM 23927 TaxID=1423727 RepID=A0A0R2B7V8_9LACO|nr:TIGR01906 family membrane protein [Lacticaseibacillus brantae]KRM71580.1 hypothetical protein FC34_GL001696 [Lacticaseibacillus brantae DSM 23927]